MAKNSSANPAQGSDRSIARVLTPDITFWLLALVFLGTAAYVSSSNMAADPSRKDIWQHVAAVRALMDNIHNPGNPFVSGDETSRHFHPLWVAAASLGRGMDLSVWAVLTVASYVSMALLAVGIFLFSRAYFQSPWGAVVLLVTLLFGWVIHIEHTGFHNFKTLLYGAAYPATFLIGLSLVLWAVTIRSVENPVNSLVLAPLAALMFTAHQLGAVIGLIGAGCFILLWRDGTLRARVIAGSAILAGLAVSILWPYHNPVLLILNPGNSNWEGGPSFYHPIYLGVALTPAFIGVWGLLQPRARPLLLALIIFTALFLIGLNGPKVAGRFMMPMILILHIGLASFILSGARWRGRAALVRAGIAMIAAFFVWDVWSFQTRHFDMRPEEYTVYEAARLLTEDIPDTEEVAAHRLTAWPVVATGQKVLSVPWPEPGIADLSARQTATGFLFDDTVPWQERVQKAGELHVRFLIADERSLPQETFDQLSELSVSSVQKGVIWRFELYQ